MAKKRMSKTVGITGEQKFMAFIASFLTIIGFVIALLAKRNDQYVMFYAKQGLVLFIIQIIAAIIDKLPLIGWFAGPVIWVIFFILWLITWINALSGKMKNTFIIGDYAKKINL